MQRPDSLEASPIYQRITDPGLKRTVEKAAESSAALLGTVVVDMPLFTLHDKTHILNVLGWMQALLEPNSIARLGQLECAFCILAAYTHDLGMTLDAAERAALPDDPAYLRHRDRFLEERHLIETLRASTDLKDHDRANLIENHLRTDFLRVTHANQPALRLRKRVREVAPELRYGNFDFRHQLELVAVSHNWPVEWLRLEFEKQDLRWETAVNPTERINFPFIGILLRLADIMDFDGSRAPALLFRHIGLEPDLINRFERISAAEWRKHMAITTPAWSHNRRQLTYVAANCPHPAIDKSIRDFVETIQREVKQVASELRYVVDAVSNDRERLRIWLPEVAHQITPAILPSGLKSYTYQDWHFRLDQEEIVRLLMGESLYGDPSLCIRELLQNALDAVELRDLRLQLRRKGVTPAQPTDGVSTRPGWFSDGGPDDEFAITLTWGERDGLQFIRVEDNGTGMTKETIECYFTQIGKSFYKSTDFNAEQAEMRRHGLLATPISTFGIGVLSCFMIADRVQVRTHPGSVSPSRPALDLEISGPGSLFWTTPGTRPRQGTEITLWLRKQHELSTHPHSEERLNRLRSIFRYPNHKRQEASQDEPSQTRAPRASIKPIDPGLVAATHVVWPKYPVSIAPPGEDRWTIDADGAFHSRQLAPIDNAQLRAKLMEWDYPDNCLSNARWKLFDWTDSKGEDATGTRLRIWYPTSEGASLADWEFGTFVEPQVRTGIPLLLVQGIRVRDVDQISLEELRKADRDAISDAIPCAVGLGFRIWLDLRGAAVPRLTADRGRYLLPGSGSAWPKLVSEIWNRFVKSLPPSPVLMMQTWRSSLSRVLRGELPIGPEEACLVGGSRSANRLAASAFLMELALAPRFARNALRNGQVDDLDDELVRDSGLPAFPHSKSTDKFGDELLGLDRPRASTLDLARVLNPERFHHRRDRKVDLTRARALDLVRAFDVGRTVARARKRRGDLGRAHDTVVHRAYARADKLAQLVDAPSIGDSLHQSSLLQEAFFPDLSRSWPALGLQSLEGLVGNAILTAPACFRFELSGRAVMFTDQSGSLPLELARHSYDLCFPMTAIPIGPLRQMFSSWRADRAYRCIGVLPFLYSDPNGVWRRNARVLLKIFSPITSIYALQPAEDLWYKPFADWTPADWNHPDHKSLLWDISTGKVLTRQGFGARENRPAAARQD